MKDITYGCILTNKSLEESLVKEYPEDTNLYFFKTEHEMSVRAKFVVENCEKSENETTVNLRAVYSNEGENASFAKYTPAANLFIVISHETPAAGFFEEGKEYYVDFTPANS